MWIRLHYSTYSYPVWPAHLFRMSSFFSSLYLWLYKNSGVHRCVWVFNSLPLSVFLPRPCSLYYCSSVVQLEIGDDETSSSSSIIQNRFSCPKSFLFPYEAEDCPFKFLEELFLEYWWILHWICTFFLVDGYFYYINFSIHKHGKAIFWYFLQFLSSMS